jgi:hypothetical protein
MRACSYPVQVVHVVMMFYPVQQLNGEHGNRLEAELSLTEIVQCFQTVAQQFHHHDVHVAVGTTPNGSRNTDALRNGAIHLQKHDSEEKNCREQNSAKKGRQRRTNAVHNRDITMHNFATSSDCFAPRRHVPDIPP